MPDVKLPVKSAAWPKADAAKVVKQHVDTIAESCRAAKAGLGVDYRELLALVPKISQFFVTVTKVNNMGYDTDTLGKVLVDVYLPGKSWADLKPAYSALKTALPPLRQYLRENVASFVPSYDNDGRIVYVTDAGQTVNDEVGALLDAVLVNFEAE